MQNGFVINPVEQGRYCIQLVLFPTFYGTRLYIIVFTRARHLSYPYPESYQLNPTPRGSVVEDVLVYSFGLHLRLVVSTLKFPLQNPVCTFTLFHMLYICLLVRIMYAKE